ncbi:hypothetical protein YC2023_100365 [Brassica napus]
MPEKLQNIWSFSYNKMPQNVAAIMRLDCADPVFNVMAHPEELLRIRRSQKLLKSWQFKFKFKFHTLTLTGNITFLRKQGVQNLSEVMFVNLNGVSQTLLDGTAKHCCEEAKWMNVPDNVILLSDDEQDMPSKRVSEKRDIVSSGKHLKILERPTNVLAREATSHWEGMYQVLHRMGKLMP